MAGTSQASNLTGMLTSIGDTIGEMGEPGRQYVQTLRDTFAPNLDMDSPDSMQAYGEYLRRNGRHEEAMAMMQNAQTRKMALRKNEGQSKIMAAAKNVATMPEGPAKDAAIDKISKLAQQYEVPALEVQQILESQSLARGKLANEVARTGIQQQSADQDLMKIENQADQFNRQFNQNAYEFDTQMAFAQDELAETRRFNDAKIYGIEQDVAQGWEGLDLEQQRVEISKALANEDITMGQFKRVIMGNEDARAAEMHPIEMQLKESQITVALANAGYTEAQTADTLYELGFKRDTETLRKDAMELQNEQTEAEIKSERANKDYIKERTKAVTAEVELGRDRYKLEEKRQAWDMGMDELQMQINQGLANSQIQLRGAQIDQINDTIRSTVLRDEILVAEAESQQISQAYKAAYSLEIDVTNPTQVANAKKLFTNAYGPEFAIDFDEAIQQRIKVEELIADTSQNAALRADSKPKTVAQLEAAGMSPQDIEAYKMLTDPQAKNQFVQTWAKRINTKEQGGAPTQALMEIYSGVAERIQKDVFGSGFLWTGAFNGVWDNDVRDDINMAMASAAAAGKPHSEVMIAGIEATYPYLQEAGSATSAQTVEGYRQKYGGDQ